MSDDREPTFLDRVGIQAEVLVPLVKAFEAELGSERARAIARDALHDWVGQSHAGLREKAPGNPVDLIAAGLPAFQENALEVEVVDRTSGRFDFNVTPWLGFLFVCDLDHAMAEGLGSDLEFDRSKTLMQGATHFDFRYRRRA